MSDLDLIINTLSIKCRGCLVESGEMKNMNEWGLIEDFYKFTGVKLDRSECLTGLLCSKCEDVLRQCSIFRTQCQQADMIIRRQIADNVVQNHTSEKSLGDKQDEQQGDTQNVTIDEKLLENLTQNIIKENEIIMKVSPVDLEVKYYLNCPFDCMKKFIKAKDLLKHLHNHNVVNSLVLTVQYYCPYLSCYYFYESGTNKFFKQLKLLKQHIDKVHKKRMLVCENCHDTFVKSTDLQRHLKICDLTYECVSCNLIYKTRETYMVHLLRKHPSLHNELKLKNKLDRKTKRLSENCSSRTKKPRADDDTRNMKDCVCDSPKRSFATQTFLKNDIYLNLDPDKNEEMCRHFTTNETQTVFEDLLSLKSQNSEDSLFFSESVTDIQTQTWPIEFGISRLNKETNTSESPDLIIKETQTCPCLFDSPTPFASTETQTADFVRSSNIKTDVLLSFSSAETQTCFDDGMDDASSNYTLEFQDSSVSISEYKH